MSDLSVEEKKALEELNILQGIIGRQDNLKARSKGLAVTLFSAITIAFTSQKLLGMNEIEYILASFSIIVLFLINESVYGATELNAERRVAAIEKFLRGEEDAKYNGPAICDALHVDLKKENLIEAAKRERTYYLYAALGIITFLIAIIA